MSRMGFTGTRDGMTPEQKLAVAALVTTWNIPSRVEGERAGYNHGDCVGADADFHKIVAEETDSTWSFTPRGKTVKIIVPEHAAIYVYPPTDPRLRARLSGHDVIVTEPKPYLDRNRDIVDNCDLLVACPKARPAGTQVTGGTWYTVNYAITKGRRVIVVWPDGQIERLTNVA